MPATTATAMPFRVRPASLEDRQQLCGLWLDLIEYHRELDPDYPRPAGLRQALLSEIERGIGRESCCVLVAEDAEDRALIGFLFAEADAPSRRRDEEMAGGWIHELWVDPGRRRLGAASALVQRAWAFFSERGSERISVRVEAGNAPGLEFWRRWGFQDCAHILQRISTT